MKTGLSESGLVPVDTVQAEILSHCRTLDPRPVPIGRALGLAVAEPIVAPADVPAFANSAMDGYAVRAADTAAAPVTLSVVGTVAAGTAPEFEVGAGQAARIMTGAPLPAGADAVVMIERTTADVEGGTDVQGGTVEIEAAAQPGDFVRHPGDDVRAGQVVIETDTMLTPAHLGLLASVGYDEVTVFPKVRVGVLSTGDEVTTAPGPLQPGQIRDANRPMLLGMITETEGEPVDLGTAPDDEGAIEARLMEGLEDCDTVLITGGVSAGDYDYVKAVIGKLPRSHRWKVAVRPAKPLAFGVTAAGKPVFGLPGNPVSSAVSFELFARPALLKMMSRPDLARFETDAVTDDDLPRAPDGKLHLVRVIASLDDTGLHVRSAGGQGSHVLSAMAAANALAKVPDGHGVKAGESVEVILLT